MFLRQNTSQVILFGPCLDIADGVTEETALTLANTDIRLSKDGGAFAAKNTGGATHDSDGWYSCTLNATDTATVGELVVNIHQPANMLPVWIRYWVIEEAVYDAVYGAAAEGPLQGTTAGNKLDVNATGEAGLDLDNTSGTLDAAQIGADAITAAKIANGAIDAATFAANAIDAAAIAPAAIDADALASDVSDKILGALTGAATSGTTTTLIDTVNLTQADTDYWKGSVLVMTSGNIAGQARRITAFNPATDEITVDTAFTQAVAAQSYVIVKTAYAEAPAAGSGDWSTAEKENIRDALGVTGTKTAASGGDVQDIQSRLPAALVGGAMDSDVSSIQANAITAAAIAAGAIDATAIGADAITAAKVAADVHAESADAVWDELLTGGTHGIADSAGRRLRDLQEFGIYEGGAVWIDTVNGSGGTTDYESGTAFNPVNTIADANTIATSLGLSRFRVAPGSTITFASAQENQSFEGHAWTLALGGQSIAGTEIAGATISGTGTGSDYVLRNCSVGAVTLADGEIRDCGLAGTFTASAAADYYFDGCFSQIAGSATWTFDFGAATVNTNLNLRHYSGGVTINNKDSSGTDLMSLEGRGQLIVAASSGGAISVRGGWRVTNTGGATITYDDLSQNAIDVLADTDDIQTRIPATLVGGAMDSDVSSIQADAINAAAIANAAIDAATFAANAIDAAALATDAVQEIAGAVWDEPKVGHVGVTTFGDIPTDLDSVLADTADIQPKIGTPAADLAADIAGVQSDTDNIQSRLPAALVGGRIDASTGAMVANVINAAALATDAVKKISDAIVHPKNTAKPDIPVFMVLTSDHVTAATGLALGVTRSIDGGAFAAGTGTAAELSSGLYQYDASAADMNGDTIIFRFTGTAADDTFVVLETSA